MRKVLDLQMKLGEIAIGNITFFPQSRDEIPKLLQGLQSIYLDRKTRNDIFKILKQIIPKGVNPNTGRSGMDLWKIFVLGSLRLCCNWDYDKLLEMANNHAKLREMLGHSKMDYDYIYSLQTLKDNIRLFTEDIADEINQVVVKRGHEIVGKKPDENLRGSCDSFAVETNVHFPTDINLLFDAIRKIITLLMKLCSQYDISGWRKGKSIIKKAKRLFHRVQKIRNSKIKNSPEKDQMIIEAHQAYIDFIQDLVDRAEESIISIRSADISVLLKIQEIEKYITHAKRQIDQIRRRVFKGESIPHHEKVFSLFEEHTEWIKKGKAGVFQELGLNVCIVKDQYGFILHHQVMQKQTDDQIAVEIIQETISKFSDFNSCSFDKGFHSPTNQEKLSKMLDHVYLPRKGKLSAINKEVEQSEEFIKARRKHAAVESSINALENSGLDRCPDHGLHGFKRYVALAILARNIQSIGHILQEKEHKKQRRQKRLQQNTRRLTA